MFNFLEKNKINSFTAIAASFQKTDLIFKKPSGTSRGIMTSKNSWLIQLECNGIKGIGECSLLQGLSIDNIDFIDAKLQEVCDTINNFHYWLTDGLIEFPAIRFGLEMALLDLFNGGKQLYFPSLFTQQKDSIRINGLIWMDTLKNMQVQIEDKLQQGFTCLKLKIGALDFNDEMALIKLIRNNYNSSQLEIRVDANGAFNSKEALDKIKQLSEFDLHSIEQPIKAGQWEEMAYLCEQSPLAIALDEELIGVNFSDEKRRLLLNIQPKYIIIKPSLLGGFAMSLEWIQVAEMLNIEWWVTSALESNIGLNAIAQFTYTLNNKMPQGLGTGSLYINNFESPLFLQGEYMWHKELSN